MDLYLDGDILSNTSEQLMVRHEELKTLRSSINASFSQLKKDWNSDAGSQFFDRFNNDLVGCLFNHMMVIEYMSQNLSTALQKYEEVFRAADAVANVQF